MEYTPDTVWGRTNAGDREMVTPSSGLSLTQRRLLKLLGQPRTFTALAVRNRLPAPKLERELVQLAQLRLVAFQRPGSPQPQTAPGIINLSLPAAKAPQSRLQLPLLPVCFVAVALGFAIVLYFVA